MLAAAFEADESPRVEAPAPTDGPTFATRGAYAERVSVSRRTLDALIARGLPIIGRGRLLRVDVPAADAWLRDHLGDDANPNPGLGVDPVEALARKNAERGR
jgi:hypothetical protein